MQSGFVFLGNIPTQSYPTITRLLLESGLCLSQNSCQNVEDFLKIIDLYVGPDHIFLKNGLTLSDRIIFDSASLLLTLQRLKVSNEPVEAKEDYTKFNTKDFKTEKVCVTRCNGVLCVLSGCSACVHQGQLHT